MDVAELEKRLAEDEDAEVSLAQRSAETPEDFWSPVTGPISGGSVDDYGTIQPVPDHDGTECLKWDDSLWTHADHFKVRWSSISEHFYPPVHAAGRSSRRFPIFSSIWHELEE